MSNFWIRTISGTAYFAVLLAALLINEFVFGAIAAIFTGVLAFEFCRLSDGASLKAGSVVSIVASVCLFAMVYACELFGMQAKYVSAVFFLMPVMLLTCLAKPSAIGMKTVAHDLACLVYIALPMSLSTTLVFRGGEFDGSLLLSFFIMICCSDVGAYCIGTAFGQKKGSRKLCTEVSPLKSWAGFWGGLGFCIAAGVILGFTQLMNIPVIHSVALSIIIHLGGTLGDLFESRWKRDAGVKDSGRIIPGHGGLLDRLDSSLIAIPAASAYLILFNLW